MSLSRSVAEVLHERGDVGADCHRSGIQPDGTERRGAGSSGIFVNIDGSGVPTVGERRCHRVGFGSNDGGIDAFSNVFISFGRPSAEKWPWRRRQHHYRCEHPNRQV